MKLKESKWIQIGKILSESKELAFEVSWRTKRRRSRS